MDRWIFRKERFGAQMLMIRLARFGAKKKPFYRVVVIEKERARNSRNIEVVGQYNPLTHPAKVELKRDRVEHWTKLGAQLSDTVKRLLEQNPAPVSVPAPAPTA
jgi:small subunit ribosomal protein S16